MAVPLLACGPGRSLAGEGAQVGRLLAAGEFFWLDLHRPDAEDVRLLGELFGFHPLALEDAQHFGQRAKIEEYDHFAFLVAYGAAPDDDRLVEVHCFYSERFLVTVHRDEAPALRALRAEHERRDRGPDAPILVLHRVLDCLTDSFFSLLEELDEATDAIEADLERGPSNGMQRSIFALRRRLIAIRKTVGPQRDMLGRLSGGVAELPGMTREAERYFRDVYDHLIRIGDLLESYRDLLSGAQDVYLATVSNRLNAVMKQLTVIATIFLPLTLVVGYFGQNFGWMVRRLDGLGDFMVFGVGVPLVVVLGLLAVFRRLGWIGG